MDTPNEFGKEYSSKKFWGKTTRFAKAAGSEVMERALQLYYASRSPDTPAWAKRTAYGALGYFLVPVDAIPDIVPAVGYGDDLGVLAMAVATIVLHITPAVKRQAADKLRDWFG